MNHKVLAILEMGTASGLFFFWILFFAFDMTPSNPPPGYFEYEHAFPLPDGMLAIALFIAGYGLWNKKKYGMWLSFVCSGALIFLGLLDFSFNIQNDMYRGTWMDAILNAGINIWAVAEGVVTIWWLQGKGKYFYLLDDTTT
ncbi:MAG: hypothetical protein GY751_03185 [Bacteroidetes bacterium]|nr:hypothetical protein [Bacteroidota bacterium]